MWRARATFSSSAPPPTSRKLAGPRASLADYVHGGHRQAGAVHHAAHAAVQLDVADAVLGRLGLERVVLRGVVQFAQVGVAEQGVVVEVDLGVGGEHPAVTGDGEGVDLDQRAVAVAENSVEALHHGGDGPHLHGSHAQPIGNPASLVWLESEAWIDRYPDDLVWGCLGDLLDVHAAGLAHHYDGTASRTVRDDADVQLALDVEGLLDQHGVDGDTLGAGLEGHQPGAQHGSGSFGGLVGG